jgi:NitT/TauT family transport system substrate-binding protein
MWHEKMKGLNIAYILIAILLVTTSVFGYMAFAPRPTQKTEEVNILFSWLLQAHHTPYFVAKDLGYFADEGLSVNLFRGYGSTVTAQAIGSGKYDYGEVMLANEIQVKAQGADLMGVLAESQISGECWISLKEKNITTPKDAEGHSFVCAVGSGDDLFFPIACQAGGINASKITRMYVTTGADFVTMLSGQADICPALLGSALPIDRAQAAAAGKELNVIVWADYGLKTLGHMLVSRESVIQAKPDQVRNLVYAVVRATDWTFKHPEEAIAILLKYNPDLGGSNANMTTAQFYEWMNLKGNTTYTRTNGWCTFNPEAVQLTVNVTSQIYNTTRYANDQVVTEQFVPKPPYTWSG